MIFYILFVYQIRTQYLCLVLFFFLMKQKEFFWSSNGRSWSGETLNISFSLPNPRSSEVDIEQIRVNLSTKGFENKDLDITPRVS